MPPIENANAKAKSVVVIGGGLAGIAACVALSQAGMKVTLIEAKHRLGGRAGSFYDQSQQQWVDYCQHVGMGCCTSLIDLLHRLDLAYHWKRESLLHFFGPKGEYVPLQANRYLPAPFHFGALLRKWPGLRLRHRAEIAYALFALMRLAPTPEIDLLPALDYLKKHRQSDHSIEHFWNTIIVSALGERLDRVALGPVRKVLVQGFAAHQDAYELLIPLRPLGAMFNEDTQQALKKRGVDIRLGSPVTKLIWNDNQQCSGVQLRNDETIQCDRVILATAWHQLGSILADSSMADIADIEKRASSIAASPITGIHTWWDRPWLELPHAAIVGRLCQWVFSSPWQGEGHYYQIVISASQELPKGEIDTVLAAIADDLREIFPAARSAQLLRGRVVTDPTSVYSLSPETAAARPSTSALADRSIFLAGDWVQTTWPATMEGAIRSGYQSADAALRSLNLPPWPLPKDLPLSWVAQRIIR